MDSLFIKPRNVTLPQWIEQLETWLLAAQRDQAEGAALISSQAGEVAAGMRVTVTPERRIQQLLEALNCYDPDNYPAGLLPCTRTTVRFL